MPAVITRLDSSKVQVFSNKLQVMKSVNQKKQAIGREFCEQQMTTCENCKFNTHPYLKLSELKFLHPKSKYFKGRILHVKNHISSFLFAFFYYYCYYLFVALLLRLVVGGRRAEGYELGFVK